jgi:hypothetical protein
MTRQPKQLCLGCRPPPPSNRKQVEHHSAKNTDDTLHDVEDDEIVRLQQSSEDPSVVLTNLGRYIAAEPQPFSILGANSFGTPMKSWDMVLLRSHFGSSPASHPQRRLLHRDFNIAWPPLNSTPLEQVALRVRLEAMTRQPQPKHFAWAAAPP